MRQLTLIIWLSALFIFIAVPLVLPGSALKVLKIIFEHIGPLSPLIIPVCIFTIVRSSLSSIDEYEVMRWKADKNALLGFLGTVIAIIATYIRVNMEGGSIVTSDVMGGFTTTAIGLSSLWLSYSICPYSAGEKR